MKHEKIYENGKFVPQRMCVACRSIRRKNDMIRVAFSDGVVKVDNGDCKSGRGAYICKNISCIEKAQKARGLERGLKTRVPAEIYGECMDIDGK